MTFFKFFFFFSCEEEVEVEKVRRKSEGERERSRGNNRPALVSRVLLLPWLASRAGAAAGGGGAAAVAAEAMREREKGFSKINLKRNKKTDASSFFFSFLFFLSSLSFSSVRSLLSRWIA